MSIIKILDVGNGFCGIIVHRVSGRFTVIDVCDKGETDPVNDIGSIMGEYNMSSVFRFILTHPEMDHLSGIAELFGAYTVTNFWDTYNTKVIKTGQWDQSPYSKDDWYFYQSIRDSENRPKTIHPTRGTSSKYWKYDGINILSPTDELVSKANEDEDYHDLSYVVKYKGPKIGSSVLFTGDVSKDAQEDILSYISNSGGDIKSDILIAPHHGSEDNYVEEFVNAVKPRYIIVSGHKYNKSELDYYSKHVASGKLLTTKSDGNIAIIINTETGKYRIMPNA